LARATLIPLAVILEGGTRLAVRLFGDRASMSVNGETPIDLHAIGNEGTIYSNGQRMLGIVQGR